MRDKIIHIENLIQSIDAYTAVLMKNDADAVSEGTPELARALGESLPQVIEVYEDERMAEHREDASYWAEQLSRIMGALEAGDFFLAADALHFELLANLKLLKEELIRL